TLKDVSRIEVGKIKRDKNATSPKLFAKAATRFCWAAAAAAAMPPTSPITIAPCRCRVPRSAHQPLPPLRLLPTISVRVLPTTTYPSNPAPLDRQNRAHRAALQACGLTSRI